MAKEGLLRFMADNSFFLGISNPGRELINQELRQLVPDLSSEDLIKKYITQSFEYLKDKGVVPHFYTSDVLHDFLRAMFEGLDGTCNHPLTFVNVSPQGKHSCYGNVHFDVALEIGEDKIKRYVVNYCLV